MNMKCQVVFAILFLRIISVIALHSPCLDKAESVEYYFDDQDYSSSSDELSGDGNSGDYNLACASSNASNLFIAGNVDESCKSNMTAYIGWPIMLSCKDAAYKWTSGKTGDTAKCKIFDKVSGKLLNTSTVTVEDDNLFKYEYFYNGDVTPNTSTIYIILLEPDNERICYYVEITLNLETIPQETCEESYASGTRHNTFQRLHQQEKLTILTCDYYGVDVEFPAHIQPKVEFLRNCSTFNNTDNETSIVHKKWRNEIHMNNIKWSTAGVYTCAVTYKNQTLYVIHRNLCVKHAQPSSAISLQCEKPSPAAIGEDAQIICYATAQESDFYHAHWSRSFKSEDKEISRKICNNEYEDANAETCSKHYNCSFTSLKTKAERNEKCYLYNPKEKGFQNELQKYLLTLTIKNVKEDDFVTYTLNFIHDDATTVTVVLEGMYDHTLMTSLICALFSGTVLFLCMMFLYLNRIYMLWFWKTKYGPPETANKKFDVYLAHYFTNEEGKMSKDSRERITSLVNALYDFLSEKNMKTFDGQREVAENGYVADNIQILNDCHRTLLVLTPEYITDHWSLHTAYKALQNMIERNVKLIIVKAPGVARSLTKVNRSSASVIHRALKIYDVIPWDGKLPLKRRFVCQLEYALPKLPRTVVPMNNKITQTV